MIELPPEYAAALAEVGEHLLLELNAHGGMVSDHDAYGKVREEMHEYETEVFKNSVERTKEGQRKELKDLAAKSIRAIVERTTP